MKAWTSRAVQRVVEPGNTVSCTGCDEWLKYRAREKRWQVICNVYVARTWDRVEHWHPQCYDQAGQPHGAPCE